MLVHFLTRIATWKITGAAKCTFDIIHQFLSSPTNWNPVSHKPNCHNGVKYFLKLHSHFYEISTILGTIKGISSKNNDELCFAIKNHAEKF